MLFRFAPRAARPALQEDIARSRRAKINRETAARVPCG
jgi:hypothetical protein